MRILIVDDDELVLRALARLLRRRGHDVIATVDSVTAILVTEDRRADVALLDVDMPVRGPELAGMLHPSCPVVFHTGNPAAAPRGARVLTKPASIESIESTLRAACGGAS